MQIGLKIVLTTVAIVLEVPITFALLKRVGVLRQRTRGLLLQLYTLSAVLFAALHLFIRCLAATDAAGLDAYYISPHDFESIGRAVELARNLSLQGDGDRWWFWLAYLLPGVALGSLTYIAAAFAAVAAHSGEQHTLSSFLRKVKSNLLRPALTVAGVGALKAAVLLAVEQLLLPMTGNKYVLRTVMLLVMTVGAALQAICAVAVVASVAEPGLCGTGALARACRLIRGKYSQANDAMVASSKLRRPFWLLKTLVAMASLPAYVKCLILIVEEMISVATVTGYYFECRNREEKEGKAGHRD